MPSTKVLPMVSQHMNKALTLLLVRRQPMNFSRLSDRNRSRDPTVEGLAIG
jgi:hypothetical protein